MRSMIINELVMEKKAALNPKVVKVLTPLLAGLQIGSATSHYISEKADKLLLNAAQEVRLAKDNSKRAVERYKEQVKRRV